MSTTSVASRSRTEWDIDLAHSSIQFSVKHLNVATVHGRFNRWAGSLSLDESGFERTQATARIDAGSVDTNEFKRDAHLRSKDFFDTENHPEITFRSTHIEKAGVGFQMAGDLTIARVTRRIALEVELVGRGKDPLGTERIGFSATTVIDRRDFGLVWSQVLEAGALLIGEKVKLEIWVEAVRRAGMSASGARW